MRNWVAPFIAASMIASTVSQAAPLSTWATTAQPAGIWKHNGIAGTASFLYTITGGTQAEVAPIHGDGSLGTWAPTSTLNLARSFAITLATATHVYIAGGFAGGGCCGGNTATVEAAPINLDGTLGPWVDMAPMQVARGNHAGALGAGRLYMLGDYGGDQTVESAAVLPDGSLSAWRAETSMQQLRERPAAAVVGNHLYVIGGLPFTNTVERADIGADGVLGPWEYATPTLEQRYHLGAAAIGSFLFALAGYNGTAGLASVEVAEETGGTLGPWTFATSLTAPKYNADATAIGATLYVAGDDGSVEYATLDTDSDKDGVPDDTEPSYCLGTAAGAAVTALGCAVDQVCPCAAPLGRTGWNRPNEYRRCVKETATELATQGRITAEERRALIRAARENACGVAP
jgi:hypothetical protein